MRLQAEINHLSPCLSAIYSAQTTGRTDRCIVKTLWVYWTSYRHFDGLELCSVQFYTIGQRSGKGRVLFKLISTLIKVAVASLVTGAVLNRLNLSAEEILLELGFTPEGVIFWLEEGMRWAIPNIILGSMVIVPVWLVVYLFRPPRS